MTPVVRLSLLLARWQDIYFGQLTEMALIFFGFYEFNLDYDRNFTEKKTNNPAADDDSCI